MDNLPEWWMLTQPYRDQVAKEFDNEIGSRYPANQIPWKTAAPAIWKMWPEQEPNPWQSGTSGKAILFDDGTMHHWQVDNTGWPHHVAYRDAHPQDRRSQVAQYGISPNGIATVSMYPTSWPDPPSSGTAMQAEQAAKAQGWQVSQNADNYDPFDPDEWDDIDDNATYSRVYDWVQELDIDHSLLVSPDEYVVSLPRVASNLDGLQLWASHLTILDGLCLIFDTQVGPAHMKIANTQEMPTHDIPSIVFRYSSISDHTVNDPLLRNVNYSPEPSYDWQNHKHPEDHEHKFDQHGVCELCGEPMDSTWPAMVGPLNNPLDNPQDPVRDLRTNV